MGEKQLLELKVRVDDLTPLATWCAREAVAVADVRQTDTYFRVRLGRLKLRVVEGEAEGTLIFYRREDRTGPKGSRVNLLRVADPATLETVLREALGALVEVRKRRRIFRWGKVQIHLDEVDGLGTFLEFERLVDSTQETEDARAEFAALSKALDLREENRVEGSYSDLMLDEDSGGRRA